MGFTLSCVASNKLNFDVMKDMAISDEQQSFKIVGTSQIKKDLKRRQINTLPSSKRIFDKRARNTSFHSETSPPKSKCHINSSKLILPGKGNEKRTPQYTVRGVITQSMR